MQKDWQLNQLYPILTEQKNNFQFSTPKFYCDNPYSTEKRCCFNHFVGLPVKNDTPLPIFDYEIDVVNVLSSKKLLWIKKATGLGITELVLRWIIFKCLTDITWKDSQVCIVTAPRLELAISLIDRINKIYENETHKSTSIMINGVKIEAFPSHHLDTMRGLPNPKCIFLDEADFFPPSMQKEALAIAERYLAKSNPYIILVSTPNMPNGLFDQIERDENSMYHKIFMPYTVGLDKIFTKEDIEIAKASPSFEREYNLKFGIGFGTIYPYELINELIQSYDLTFTGGQMVRTIDPAFGSSKFAIMETEMLDGIAYPKYCVQIDRPSPTAMTELIVLRNAQFPMPTLVDSAHPGLIRDLVDRNVSASEVRFNSELSNMTIEGSQMVKEKRVRFHPDICQDLTAQLKSVEMNEKGHPDKKKLNFDLGDCYQMMANYFKNSRASILKMSQYDEEEDM